MQSNQLLTNIINQYQGFLAVKNLDSRYIMANREAAKWYGFDSSNQIIDNALCDAEMPCKAAEFADELVQEDKQVMQSGKPTKILGHYCFADDNWIVCIGQKSPYYDEQGHIAGVICNGLDVTGYRLIDFASIVDQDKRFLNKREKQQASYILVPQFDDHQLTKRQSECMYFLLRGKTAKEIAERLFLSVRTVETHLDQIKQNFQCSTKSALIEQAIQLGMLQLIPESLLHNL